MECGPRDTRRQSSTAPILKAMLRKSAYIEARPNPHAQPGTLVGPQQPDKRLNRK